MARRTVVENDTPRRRRDIFGEPAEQGTAKSAVPAEDLPDDDADLDMLADGTVRPENGVNVSWLCTAFGLSRRTVINKLAGVRPIRLGARHAPIYDIGEAASRLVEAKINYFDALRNMRPQDLPPMLQAVFWDAMIKKLDWEKKAKQLWHTDDVLDVLTDMFKTLRTTMQLWPDELEKEFKLSDEQLDFIRSQVDLLQGELHAKLIARAGKSMTGPVSDIPPDAVSEDDE